MCGEFRVSNPVLLCLRNLKLVLFTLSLLNSIQSENFSGSPSISGKIYGCIELVKNFVTILYFGAAFFIEINNSRFFYYVLRQKDYSASTNSNRQSAKFGIFFSFPFLCPLNYAYTHTKFSG